ncbi:MAG: N-acetyltransferase family protein [Pirellulales bacterium]
MKLIRCDESHTEQILAIFNDAISHTTALYEYQPRTPEFMQQWFANKQRGNYPVLGLLSDNDRLMGFASYGPFRTFPAYRYTVEHSVYVQSEFRGQGVGITLLRALIDEARSQKYHVMIGGIDSGNVASIALHKKLGFNLRGTLPQVGFKFDRWLDLCFYHLVLEKATVQ